VDFSQLLAIPMLMLLRNSVGRNQHQRDRHDEFIRVQWRLRPGITPADTLTSIDDDDHSAKAGCMAARCSHQRSLSMTADDSILKCWSSSAN
jgi:hypothetical protein